MLFWNDLCTYMFVKWLIYQTLCLHAWAYSCCSLETGNGSAFRRKNLVMNLMRSCRGMEMKFLVRTLVEEPFPLILLIIFQLLYSFLENDKMMEYRRATKNPSHFNHPNQNHVYLTVKLQKSLSCTNKSVLAKYIMMNVILVSLLESSIMIFFFVCMFNRDLKSEF